MIYVGPHAEGLESGGDLVTRALALVGVTGRVEVDKQIPRGAGLGGGSADAAAILRWVGFDDVEAAARLGADVPFCVLGGRARVTGVGEVLEPLPPEDRTFTLLDAAAPLRHGGDLPGLGRSGGAGGAERQRPGARRAGRPAGTGAMARRARGS